MNTPSGELAVGTVIGDGRFAIIGTLGVGAQGTTYEAIDKLDGSVVALKEFSIRGASSWKDVELAEREASVLASLSHPLLPRYLAHFEERGSLYLAMERVEGSTLRELKQRRAFEQRDVLAFLNDVAETLSYLHTRAPPVIHRDIKPSNVLRRSDGRFVLVDFGSVASVLKPEGGSTVVGTFGYMAPEQFQGRAMPATDTYAVGATALAMLTGLDPDKLPHKGLAIDVEAALGSSTSPALRRFLVDATNPDPDARSQNPLSTLLTQHQLRRPTGPSPSGPEPARAPPRAPKAGKPGARERDARHPPRHRRRHPSSKPGRSFDRRSAWLWLQLPPVLFAILFGLWVARLASAALMMVMLPTLLFALSIAFGSGPRRGARQCLAAGRRGQRALREISARVKELAASPNPWSDVATPGGSPPEKPSREQKRDEVSREGRRWRVEDLETELESDLEKNLEELEERVEKAVKSERFGRD